MGICKGIFFDFKLLFIQNGELDKKDITQLVAPFFKEVIATAGFLDVASILKDDCENDIKIVLIEADNTNYYVFDILKQIKTLRQDIFAIVISPKVYSGAFKHIVETDKKNVYIRYGFEVDEFIESVRTSIRKREKQLKKDRLEYFLTQYQAALNEVAQIVKFDIDGTVKYTNNYLNTVFGYGQGEMNGYHISRIIQSEINNGTLDEVMIQISKKDIWKGQVASRRKDGEIIYGDTTVVPLLSPHGKIVECLLIRHDVTELIKESNAAKESERAKDEFLANMSHEIRTPLNAVIGYAQLLKNSDIPQSAKEYVEIIDKSGNSLLNIVNQILDLSKIQSGHFELFPVWFNAKEEFESVRKLFMLTAMDKNIDFSFTVDNALPDRLYCDIVRLKQVLINLIGNAFKFTSSKISVKIVVAEKDEHDVSVLFSVVDDGIGISKTEQKNIFKPFTQEDSSTTKKYGGTGIGLSISSEILGLMGSNIFLQSEKGEGSEFSFMLQLHYECVDDIQPRESCNMELHKKSSFNAKILVVEDNEINRMLIGEMLLNFGITVCSATNGLEAVNMCEAQKYDLIFMDIDMPIMNGIEATDNILKAEKEKNMPHTPIVALTANVITGEKQRCLDAGMDDYLGKPFNISDLEGILKKHIRKTVYDKYDLGKISTSIGVTPEVALQYIERFLDAFSKELKDMEGYAKSGDFAALRITAHKYKGTAGMFGFDEARQTLGAIESKAKGLLASGGDVQSDSISPDSIFRDDFEALKAIFDTK
mgnify:FL=1